MGGVGRLRYGTRRRAGVAGIDARGTGATAWATGTQCPRFGKLDLVPGSATQEHAYAYRLVYEDMSRITKIVMPFEGSDRPRETTYNVV